MHSSRPFEEFEAKHSPVRILKTDMESDIWYSSTKIRTEVADGRIAAHKKHGDNSIEAVDADDLRWVAIVGEEVGEWMAEWNYDRDHTKRRAEALDVLSCLTAWIAAYDRKQEELAERAKLLNEIGAALGPSGDI